jgi:hypothetical protein
MILKSAEAGVDGGDSRTGLDVVLPIGSRRVFYYTLSPREQYCRPAMMLDTVVVSAGVLADMLFFQRICFFSYSWMTSLLRYSTLARHTI